MENILITTPKGRFVYPLMTDEVKKIKSVLSELKNAEDVDDQNRASDLWKAYQTYLEKIKKRKPILKITLNA